MRSHAFYILCFGLVTLANVPTSAEEPLLPAKQLEFPAKQLEFPAGQLEFFEKHVRPLLATHCYECHSAKATRIEGSLLLDSRNAHLTGGDSGEAIVPGDADGSLLIEWVGYDSYEMPPKGKLADNDIATLERWVNMGAPWPDEAAPTAATANQNEFDLEERQSDFWVWQPIADTDAPKVQNSAWPRNEIDRHILGGLEEAGLKPSRDAGRKELKLDLYYPTAKRSKECPVVVFTHGGGWAAGNRYKAASGSFEVVFQRLIQEGFAVAPVTYRLAKKDSGVAMRDCVIDCKDAIRYLAKNSDSLGIDPTRICVMGDSAGGHIAQMLLLASAAQLPGDEDLASSTYRMLAGVSWYGPCDFENTDLFNHDDRADFRDRFGPRILGSDTGPNDKLKRYREVSPINYLSKDSPPLLMIQGDQDTTIPVKHAHHMKQKADAISAPVEIMIIKNAGHNWRKVDADIDPSREVIIQRTVQFFVERLENKPE